MARKSKKVTMGRRPEKQEKPVDESYEEYDRPENPPEQPTWED